VSKEIKADFGEINFLSNFLAKGIKIRRTETKLKICKKYKTFVLKF
jgi:hypothetical protein